MTQSNTPKSTPRAKNTPRARTAALLLLCVAAATGLGAVGVAGGAATTEPRSLVGEWERVTTCSDLGRRLETPGFHEMALESAAGNGFIPGVTSVEDIADPSHPCRGAIPRRHSHFFTSDGLFGSRDWNGGQVDEGTYQLIGDNTLVMPYGFEDGPPIDVAFHYRIAGETVRFDPVLPEDCSTSRCREAAGWSITVALEGKSWRRVD